VCGRPAGWRVLADRAPGSAGLTQGCRCALPLQAWAWAYRGGRPRLQLVGIIIIIIVLLFVVYFAATVYIMVNKYYQKVDNTRKTSRYPLSGEQIGADSLTLTPTLTLDFLNPKSVGCGIMSMTTTVPHHKSFRSAVHTHSPETTTHPPTSTFDAFTETETKRSAAE